MDLAVMVSHRNLIFSASESVSIGKESAKMFPVWCPYLLRKCKDDLQIARCPENPRPFGSLTLVSCNGRKFLHVPAIPFPLHISRTPPLEC